MPTIRTRTVKASGGNYTSLTGWEAGEKANLTSTDEIREAEFYDEWPTGLNDANAFNSGWTVDSTRFVRLKVASGHGHTGQVDTGFFLSTGNHVIRPVTACSNIQIIGLGIRQTGNFSSITNLNGATGIHAENCFLWWGGGGAAANSAIRGVDGALNAWSNFVVGMYDGIRVCTNVYNNTVYNSANRGIVQTGGFCRNNIAVGTVSLSDIDNGGGTHSNNLTEDATGQITSRTIKQRSDLPLGAGNYVIFESTTAGAEDLNLVDDAENDALNAGTDLTGTFTTDYEGDTRSTTPDLGADEVAAAGGGTSPTVALTGVSASGSAGTLAVVVDDTITLTGVSATGAIGTLTISVGGNITLTPTGVSATGSAGTLAVSVADTVVLTGVSATGNVGSVTVIIPASATVNLTGVSASGAAGDVTVRIGGVWVSVDQAGGTWSAVATASGTWTPQ